MFCSHCGAELLTSQTHCESCGWLLHCRDETTSLRPVLPSERSSSELKSVGRTATMLLPFGIALIVGLWFSWNVISSRQDEASAYEQAENALRVGNYDAAIDYFIAAGSYRDAAERRSLTQELLTPVRTAYLDALSAMERGEYDLAIALLDPIAASMPEFENVGPLLEESRSGLLRSLERQVDIAVVRQDWMTADHTLVALSEHDPLNAAYTEELSTLRRNHAPIIFVRAGKLFEIGPDGENERLLFDDFPISNPRWSPDRQYITFLNAEAARSQVASLYLFDYASGATSLISDIAAPDPLLAWNHDSTRLAFVAYSTSGLTASRDRTFLLLYELNSTERRSIFAPPPEVGAAIRSILHDVTSPTWSADGTQLAFVVTRSPASMNSSSFDAYADVYSVDLASGEMRNVTNGAIPTVAFVSWSPVAGQLLTWEAKGGTVWFESLETAVHVIDLDSGQMTRLTMRTEMTAWPLWSPDGKAFAVVADGSEVIVRSIGGTLLYQIPSAWKLDGSLSWSPGGAALLAVAEDSFEPSVLLDLQEGEPTVSPLLIEFDGNWPNLGPQWSSTTPRAATTAKSP